MGTKAIVEKLENICDYLRRIEAFDDIYIRLKALYRKQNLKWYKCLSYKEYAKINNKKYVIIENPTECEVCRPTYFEKDDMSITNCFTKETYLCEVDDAKVIGATGITISDNMALYDAFAYDYEDKGRYSFGPLKAGKGGKLLIETVDCERTVERAINLCGFAATNYFHFTIEIVSKLSLLNESTDYREWPLLIDSAVTQVPQLMQLLDMVNVEKREYITVPYAASVKVKKLVHPSMTIWMPLNVKKQSYLSLEDNVMSQRALNWIEKSASCYIKEQEDLLIYLSRKDCLNSRIDNEEEVIQLLIEKGFEICYLEKMTFYEQVELFSRAKCIVGATGAAFTNVVYCHSNTIVGCIIPSEYDFNIYSTISNLKKCIPIFFDATISQRAVYSSKEKYHVDINLFEKYADMLCENAKSK